MIDEDDDVDVVVQPVDVVGDRGDRLLKGDLLGRWLAGARQRRPGQAGPAPQRQRALQASFGSGSARSSGALPSLPTPWPRHAAGAATRLLGDNHTTSPAVPATSATPCRRISCSGTARRFTKHNGRRGLKGSALRHKVALLERDGVASRSVAARPRTGSDPLRAAPVRIDARLTARGLTPARSPILAGIVGQSSHSRMAAAAPPSDSR